MILNKHLILSLMVVFSLGLAQGAFAAEEVTPTGGTTDSRYFDGKVGIGTSTPGGLLEVYQSSTNKSGIRITGTGYAGGTPSSEGIAIVLGYNDSGNRQCWIGATDNIGQYDKSIFRFLVGSKIANVDAVNGTGNIRLPVNLGTISSDVAVGNGSLAYNATLPGKLSVYNEAAKVGLAIVGIASQTGDYLNITSGGGAAGNIVTINSTGNVGIGTTTPTNKLHVVGNGYFTGTVTTGSSRSLKKDIEPLSEKEAISALQELKPIKYFYKADDKDQKLGFVAEDVPGLVAENDRKSLSSMDLATLAITVIQKQQKMIENLQKENKEIKKSVAELSNEKS